MANYKQASKDKLRIVTKKGTLSVEQLWDLSLIELDSLAVKLDEECKQSANKKSFLTENKNEVDNATKAAFDIVVDILQTKAKIAETAAKAAETKAHNERIFALIDQKKRGKEAEMSIEELEKLIQ